ncbi:MAG: marine proteobacterial sortase target protein [Gammaproteobacteria bacterium]|nr:marine proteobacterial sortase target protein [Gammaproteobacteria bacterium]
MQTIKSDLRSWLWILALLLVLQALPEPASANETLPDAAQTGSLLWRMGQGYTTATTLNTDVRMEISGLVARVRVRQEFRNEGGDWVEGIYVFPLPDKAAVDRMRLHIGDRFIEGEIREKEQAKKEYEQAKQSGKKASLVQQQRANLFTTSVANVAPGERVVVEIEYLEDLRYEDGRFSIRFPMTLTPRYVPGKALPDKQGNGWSADTDQVPDASLITPPQVSRSQNHKISLTADVNAGMPLEIIASRYHPVSVSEKDGHYTVALSDQKTVMDHDFELVWQPVPSAEPRAMAFAETINGKSYQLLMVMPPNHDNVLPVHIPRETIFIVDTSGSMHGVSMSQAKRAVNLAIKALKPGDLFNVIEFDSYTTALYPLSKPASANNVAKAVKFVQQLQADGGTEMRPALKLAFSTPVQESHLRQIVFITDGSVGYEDQMFSMIEQNLGDARLFTVGIGSAPNSLFMRKAAEAGRGSYTYVSALHEVSEKMEALFRKLEHPQVTDINMHWPSGVIVDSYPATVPDLYLGEPVSVKVQGSNAFRSGDVLRITGNTVAGAWAADLALDTPVQSKGIAALWARARIGELMGQERRGGNAEALRAGILETALTHHLVSKYTSLIAVDKTPARPSGDPLSSEQVPNLMPYGQSTNAIFGFPATATSAPAMRIMGAAWLLAAFLFVVMLRTGRRRYHGRRS